MRSSVEGPAARDPKVQGSTTEQDPLLHSARRRAALVAAIAGLTLLPWFAVVHALVALDPSEPSLGGPDPDAMDFYVANYARIPLHVSLFVAQWVILLVLLVAFVRAATRRLDLAAMLAVSLAGAATAVYVTAEGRLLWPALPTPGMDADKLRGTLDPALAEMAAFPRDGIHAVASILLGFSVIVIGWLLTRSDLWGHWAMAVLGIGSGVLALTAALVGPEGFGPGLVLVLWAPISAVLLLIGLQRTRRSTPVPATPGR